MIVDLALSLLLEAFVLYHAPALIFLGESLSMLLYLLDFAGSGC